MTGERLQVRGAAVPEGQGLTCWPDGFWRFDIDMTECHANCIHRRNNRYKTTPAGRLILNKSYAPACKTGECNTGNRVDETGRCLTFEDWDTSPKIKRALEETRKIDERKAIREEFRRVLCSGETAKRIAVSG